MWNFAPELLWRFSLPDFLPANGPKGSQPHLLGLSCKERTVRDWWLLPEFTISQKKLYIQQSQFQLWLIRLLVFIQCFVPQACYEDNISQIISHPDFRHGFFWSTMSGLQIAFPAAVTQPGPSVWHSAKLDHQTSTWKPHYVNVLPPHKSTFTLTVSHSPTPTPTHTTKFLPWDVWTVYEEECCE